MGLHRFQPEPSGRMGILSTLVTIKGAALLEFGSMGHMRYGRTLLQRRGVKESCRLYATHLDEADISLGGTERLTRAVEAIARTHPGQPLFLLPSSVPEITGVDLFALSKMMQPDYPENLMVPFGGGGFKTSFYQGVEETLLTLVKVFPKEREKTGRLTFNLLGTCSDQVKFQSDAREIQRMMAGAFGAEPLVLLSSHTSSEELEGLGAAHINLVIRQEGEKAAIHLKERFGTPYLRGRPYGLKASAQWLSEVGRLLGRVPNPAFLASETLEVEEVLKAAMPRIRFLKKQQPKKARLSLGGHTDVVKGIGQFATEEAGLVKGAFWCDSPEMAEEHIPYFSESRWLKEAEKEREGIVMARGDLMEYLGKPGELTLAQPDAYWRLNAYEPPYMGFRGAINLICLWYNALFSG